MAQEYKVMIFPDLRLSELERDRRQKKAAFEASSQEFKISLKKKLKPLNIIRHNPKTILTIALSLFSMSKLLGKTVAIPIKKKGLSKLISMGWSLQLAGLAGKWGIKFLMPVAASMLKSALRNGTNGKS